MPPQTSYSLQELRESLPQADFTGDSSHRVSRFVHPSAAGGPDDLVLVMSEEYLAMALSHETRPAVVTAKDLAEQAPHLLGEFPGVIMLARPRLALAHITPLFPRHPPEPVGIHPSAFIDATALLGEGVAVGPNAVIERNARVGDRTTIGPCAVVGQGSTIGADCLLRSGVSIADHVSIGDRVVVNQNAVIGSDGFSFVTAERGNAEVAREEGQFIGERQGGHLRIDSLGTVEIGDDVEIGACTCIDRATLEATRIKSGTKIDNLVQIGHNNVVGEDVLICGQAGVAGSSKIGNRVILGGQVGCGDQIQVGDDAILTAQSGIISDLEGSAVYAGYPAQPIRKFFKGIALVRKLEGIQKRLRRLETKP